VTWVLSSLLRWFLHGTPRPIIKYKHRQIGGVVAPC
jgi:hypothetical protein